MTIAPFLEGRVFGPQDIQAMSKALEDVCAILKLADDDKSERELLAKKLIAFAQAGERNGELLRDRVLREIASGQGGWGASLIRGARYGAL
jgi:hypothetical protein